MTKLIYKLIYIVAAKIAGWAGEKAGIEDEQKKSAEDAEKAIKDAANNIKDKPVDPTSRSDSDIFNSSNWGSKPTNND